MKMLSWGLKEEIQLLYNGGYSLHSNVGASNSNMFRYSNFNADSDYPDVHSAWSRGSRMVRCRSKPRFGACFKKLLGFDGMEIGYCFYTYVLFYTHSKCCSDVKFTVGFVQFLQKPSDTEWECVGSV